MQVQLHPFFISAPYGGERLATALPGKEFPVPIIRVRPRAILGIFEHIKISRHCGKPRLISQSLPTEPSHFPTKTEYIHEY
jgi:hypothetical protein